MNGSDGSDAAKLAEQMKGDHILIVFDKENFAVGIHGNVANLDMAMAILMQAHRELETQWRIARGIAAQQQVNQQKADAARVASILDKSLRRN
jgi:hypothetical protein